MNKEPNCAGTFYPANIDELNKMLDSFKDSNEINYKSKAVIAPHAGYLFSGHAAMTGLMHLEPNENIFIIAPSHYETFTNIAMPEYTYFDTPLGSVEVNNRLIKEISEKYPCIVSNVPFNKEHSIEVQLPIIQNIFFPQKQNAMDFVKSFTKLGKKIRIIPILVGRCDYKLISDIISEYWETSSFIISSDLSHFYTQEISRQIDNYTAAIIETGKIDCFQNEQACGIIGIKGLVDFANKNNYSLIRAEMYNSGDVTGDKERVVGYGSWFLYQGERNNYIEQFYQQYIINIVKETIKKALNGEDTAVKSIPPALSEYGATFVTLSINKQLRGCIGSIYPTKPLIIDLIDNSKNAAFNDPRFIPLTKEEFEHVKISVSILSSIERINFKDEKDLLSKIYPYGIIITEKDKRAVYLPVVWEQLPDREIFLSSLKEKAGLPPTYFSRTLEAYKFTATSIKEESEEI